MVLWGVKYKDQKVKMQIFLDAIHKSLIQYSNEKCNISLRNVAFFV